MFGLPSLTASLPENSIHRFQPLTGRSETQGFRPFVGSWWWLPRFTTMSSLFVALFALIVSSFRTRCPSGRSTVRLLSEKAIQTGTKRSKANGRIPLVLLHFVGGVCTASRPKLRYEPEGREFESPRAHHSLNLNDLIRVNFTGSVCRGNQKVGNSSPLGRATYLS